MVMINFGKLFGRGGAKKVVEQGAPEAPGAPIETQDRRIKNENKTKGKKVDIKADSGAY
jgi:hypothetical protein